MYLYGITHTADCLWGQVSSLESVGVDNIGWDTVKGEITTKPDHAVAIVSSQWKGIWNGMVVTCTASAVQSTCRLSYLLGLLGYYLCKTASAGARVACLGLSFVLGLHGLCSFALLF